ncbi:2-hydroxyisoflavanone dehydratase [Bertholletia excelsa]
MLSAFAPHYDSYARLLACKTSAIVVSVEYRLAPENPIPACYDDAWAVLKWVASHADGSGPDQWLNEHGDFGRVFVGGDSAGGNISHTVAFRVGAIGLGGVRVIGAFLVHPYFGGVEADDRMWMYMCPTNTGFDDPRMKPPVEDLARLGCDRVLVIVAGKDHLREPGMAYFERLKKSGWKGRQS